MLTAVAIVILILAILPAVLFVQNLRLYVAPPRPARSDRTDKISVLIPARNEERSIEAAVRSVIASRDIDFELLVLDDHSDDRTAEIVEGLVSEDSRIQLLQSAPLPPGWSGKQYACWQLAQAARSPLLCFLDADVRLAPDALSRMANFLRQNDVDLASGVPRQITVTWFEQLLIPLIHFILLGYLPIGRMRASTDKAYAAGCGQIFICRTDSYFRTGGHVAIRRSLHDGITLPAAFREHALRTDLFDATEIASCRMYSNAGHVWFGLAKNATEGMAAPNRIGVFTFLLLFGQFLPLLVMLSALREDRFILAAISALAFFISLLPRLISVVTFQQPFWSALCHPIGTLVLLAIQWYALIREKMGRPSSWKGRTYIPADAN